MTTALRFFTVEQLTTKIHKTPEGYLICHDVPLGRVGEQIYGPGETPLTPDRFGAVRVLREPEEVFSLNTIASAQGKPVVRDHPDGMEVTARTWRDFSKGHIINPHRGDASDADVLLGDLMVTDADEVERVEKEIRRGERPEVSLGYDCDYEEIGEPGSGLGRQRNIVINHVALVDRGRCGPRCAIGDTKPTEKVVMAKKPVKSAARGAFDRLRGLLTRTTDAKEIGKALDDAEKEMEEEEEKTEDSQGELAPPHIAIHNHSPGGANDDKEGKEDLEKLEKKMDDGFKKIGDAFAKMSDTVAKLAGDKKTPDDGEGNKKILNELEFEAPPGSGDAIRKANDSALMEDSYQSTLAGMEIIAPGLHHPAFDAKLSPAKTFELICGGRRKALDMAVADQETRIMLDGITGGRTMDAKTADCAQVRSTFNALVAMKRAANNSSMVKDANRIGDLRSTNDTPGPIKSIADINKFNAAKKAASRANA